MLTTIVAALIAPACYSHTGTCEDWRHDLPVEVARIVARVDDKLSVENPPVPPPDPGPRIDPKHRKELDDDIRMGREYAAQVEREMKLSKDADGIARVQRIGGELATIANDHIVRVTWGDPRLNPFEYTFKLIEGKDVNAFSLPGGFIFVYEGLLTTAETDDELAGVLAHEISHASFRHIATLQREASKMQSITLPLILIAILTGGNSGAGLLTGTSLLDQAINSGWSVKAEQSADFGAVQYMLKSRYNPVGVLTFMERLHYKDRYASSIDWGIYRTHPPTRDRADSIRQRLDDVGIPIERSKVTRSLRTLKTTSDDGAVTLSFAGTDIVTFAGPDATARAARTIQTLDPFMDRVPKLYEVRANGAQVAARGRTLFIVGPADAQRAKSTVEVVAAEAAEKLKKAIYDLGYRVWDF